MRQSVTVGELNEYVRSALENDPMTIVSLMRNTLLAGKKCVFDF